MKKMLTRILKENICKLFYEQAAYERGNKINKLLLDVS